ncbi:ribokinase [Acuticoccus sp. MNP-M23]|uniref:ribokinase n=1 Tax=Acuticoccus sp. MNP-M23 TaxID=3072793 RepID=UPI002814CBD9|nr:ribokinase [Acuticoccus sp. MNP-M23]WMS40993.1 ribokinase [Acuticoccus sp. MNP-M23]
MGRVAVLGIFNADLTFEAGRLPAMGETILGENFRLGPGGKGSNQAVAAARAGATVSMVTRIGKDAFGETALATWHADGIATDAVIRDDARPTGTAFIFVSTQTRDNAIIVASGAAGALSPADIDGAREAIAGADVFVTQLEQPIPAAERGLALARDAGVTTIFNPAPAAEVSDALLALCDYVTPNQGEVAALTGLPAGTLEEARIAAEHLRRRGARAVIVTLGELGALYHDGTVSELVEAVSAGPIEETTGAGDCFNGALAAALSEGAMPLEAVRFACAAAGIAVTRAGASAAMPNRAEIDGQL